MTEFSQLALQIGKLTVVHLTVMFWYLTLAPFLISPFLQVLFRDGRRTKLLHSLDRGQRSVLAAAVLGFCSPPGRSKSFADAQRLFAEGVSPLAVLTYLVSTHSLLVYFVFLIPAMNGPQPLLGLGLGGVIVVVFLAVYTRTIPAEEWEAARDRLAATEPAETPARNRWLASAQHLYGDVRSLGWPLLYGLALGALVAAWGLGSGFFSIAGDRGAIAQLGNAVAGVTMAAAFMVPSVGNVLVGGWLWKAEFFTYSGLMAFYMGVLTKPFAYREYRRLFGRRLGRRVYGAMALSIIVSAGAITSFWYGIDGLAGAIGVREWAEGVLGSTIRPSAVPWFHTLFQGGEHAGMSGM